MKTTALTSTLGLLLAVCLNASPAGAQNARTWVASFGGGSTCSRAAPCATFAAALAVTNAGGMINCVDAVTDTGLNLNKSVTIDCTGTFAGFVVPADSVGLVTVGDQVVTLRGLSIEGAGVGGTGVQVTLSSVMHIENCRISGFRGAGGLGNGIRMTPSMGSTAQLYVTDTLVTENGLAASGGGIVIQPAATGSARVVLDRVQVHKNTHGIQAIGTGGTGPIVVQVRDSVVTGSAGNGIAAITNAGASPTGIVVHRTSSIGNAGSGILAQGAGALVHLGSSSVVGNGAGLNAASGGQIFSYQNNEATGNSIDGAPTGVLTVK
jgi:hypothetical protein